MLTPEIFKSIDPLAYQLKLPQAAPKEVQVVRNVISTCLGSSSAKLGNTAVIVGITGGIFVPPIEDEAALGKLSVVCDYSLMLPGERRAAQTVASSVSDKIEKILNNKDVFDRAQLKQEGLWDITVNILVVRDDGGLIDCALLAVVAAIQATHLEGDRVLAMKAIPVALTFCRGASTWLADPTKDQEAVFARLTIVVSSEDMSIYGLFGLEGPGATAFSMSDVVGGEIVNLINPLLPNRIAALNA